MTTIQEISCYDPNEGEKDEMLLDAGMAVSCLIALLILAGFLYLAWQVAQAISGFDAPLIF